MNGPVQAMTLIGEHVQRINHDLRTPLGTLGAALDLLLGEETGDAVIDAETRRVMQRQLTRLGTLVDDLQVLADELVRRGL